MAWRDKMAAMNAATAAANATLQAFKAAERERERLMDTAIEGESKGPFWAGRGAHECAPCIP